MYDGKKHKTSPILTPKALQHPNFKVAGTAQVQWQKICHY